MGSPRRRPLGLPDLRELQQILLTESVDALAQAVVIEAAGSEDAELSCGITLQRRPDGQLRVASSDALAQRLEALQQSERDGPCIQALSTGRVVELDATSDTSHWPMFTEQARQVGVQATLSMPLQTPTGTVGVLNLYRKGSWSEAERNRAAAFAEHVAPTMALAQRLAPLEDAVSEEVSADQVSQLREQVTHDELTGLLNRRGIADVLGELLDNGLRDRVAVLFCDLDNFKRINDGLGHDAGDEVLRTLAARLRGGLPVGCSPARMSGDEFVIVCADVAATGGIEALTSQVSELLQMTMPLGQQVVEISASVGACTVTSPGITAEDLFRYADATMFTAKDRGPASVSIADPSLITQVDRQLSLESDLRQALDEDELVLHYQPIVDRTGTIVLAEALLRWPHPHHGMLSPQAILQAASRGNLTHRLDTYVLRAATTEAAAWTGLATHPPAVAINLSTVPEDPRFSEALTRIIDHTGLDWTRLVIEITETALASLAEPARTAMVGLTGRGMRFALDDFGTGYSSLSRLEQLPVDIIKLDRSFTADLPNNPIHRGISTAVIAMATSMNHTCIAEGVETPAQFQILANLGYPTYQGFLFCPPVPAHELRTLITTSPLAMPLNRTHQT